MNRFTKTVFKVLPIVVSVLAVLAVVMGLNQDADADGISDNIDNCPGLANPSQIDSDSDLQGNECDLDDDNDGVIDVVDSFDNNPLEWDDFDNDGIGSVEDTDDDNDGILDVNDETPMLVSDKITKENLNDIQRCKEFEDNSKQLLCFGQFFGDLTKKLGNNGDALETAITFAKIGLIDDCHFIAHEIGHVSFEENPNVVSILSVADGTQCRGGFFHGVMASYFHNLKENGEDISDSYKILCNELIGSSNYQDCIHGLGHGLVHYYPDDLGAAIEKCHNMSFYQNILCIKGVMMQYTDNQITRAGLTKSNLSNLCSKSELITLDFQQCNMSIGSTIAFNTNHNLERGLKYCELIDEKDAESFCVEGLRLEITDSIKYVNSPLTNELREKYQPQLVKVDGKELFIDIRSPAIISDFVYFSETKFIQFSFDRPSYIIMYIPNSVLPKESILAVNGKLAKDVVIDNQMINGYTSIQLVPQESGLVQFTPR